MAAQTAVAAENVCIDLPIDNPEDRAAAAISPAEFASQRSTGELTTDELSGDRQAALSSAANALQVERPEGPTEAAFKDFWEGRDRLAVFFLEGSAAIRKIVLDQANRWAEHAKIEFRLADRMGGSDIRVTFRPGQGHKSFVGRSAGNRPGDWTMNLDMNDSSVGSAYNLGVILHEFGHALGMVHEHQSPGAGGVRFKSAAELLPYFSVRGLRTIEAIEFNIVRRYQASELKRFSVFDPDSIMLYSFPAELTTNNQGTKQNTVLSAKDKEFVGLMYGTRGGTTPVTPVTPAKQTLTLGGEALEGRLAAGVTAEFNLNIPASQAGKDIAIATAGTTQVMLRLLDAAGQDVTPKVPPGHGSYDLMNEIIWVKLPAGDYKLAVAHPSLLGGGSFRIQARPGGFNGPLVHPNRPL
ncbi:MAG: M12 family metallopeptidase [Planctomycetaceae bacterium]|nr:M12 family metallopeptidase [Planctomycetaceae bacterium]